MEDESKAFDFESLKKAAQLANPGTFDGKRFEESVERGKVLHRAVKPLVTHLQELENDKERAAAILTTLQTILRTLPTKEMRAELLLFFVSCSEDVEKEGKVALGLFNRLKDEKKMKAKQ